MTAGFLVSKWGGKNESNKLKILQTSLVLNTFVQNIKIVQLHKNSHEYLVPLPWFLHQSASAWNVTYAKGEFPLWF
jgi:hypothetical protein